MAHTRVQDLINQGALISNQHVRIERDYFINGQRAKVRMTGMFIGMSGGLRAFRVTERWLNGHRIQSGRVNINYTSLHMLGWLGSMEMLRLAGQPQLLGHSSAFDVAIVKCRMVATNQVVWMKLRKYRARWIAGEVVPVAN